MIGLGVSGCSLGDNAYPTPECLAVFEQAATVEKPTILDLHPALERCAGLMDWMAASAAEPSVLDGYDPAAVAYSACGYGGALEEWQTCVDVLKADPLGYEDERLERLGR